MQLTHAILSLIRLNSHQNYDNFINNIFIRTFGVFIAADRRLLRSIHLFSVCQNHKEI